MPQDRGASDDVDRNDRTQRSTPDQATKKRRKRGLGRLLPAPTRSARLYCRIDPSRVHMFRFLLEAEDNLGIMTVVDRWKAVLLVRFSPHQEKTIRAALAAMQKTLPFTILDGLWSSSE